MLHTRYVGHPSVFWLIQPPHELTAHGAVELEAHDYCNLRTVTDGRYDRVGGWTWGRG